MAAATSTRRRLLGAVGILFVLLLWRSGDHAGLLSLVVLPAVAALAAWAVTGSVLAVAIGTALLAGAHSEPGASAPIPALVYPAACLVATLVVAVLLGRRFAAAMAVRRAQRRTRTPPSGPDHADR